MAAKHVFIGCVRARGLPGRMAWARMFNAFAGADGPLFRQVGVVGVRRTVKAGVLGQVRFFPCGNEPGLRVRVIREEDQRLRLWTRGNGAWSMCGQRSEDGGSEVWELPGGRVSIGMPSIWQCSPETSLPFWILGRGGDGITATLDVRSVPERGVRFVHTMEYVVARARAGAVGGRADVISTDPIVTAPEDFWAGVANGSANLRRMVDALCVCQRIRVERSWERW